VKQARLWRKLIACTSFEATSWQTRPSVSSPRNAAANLSAVRPLPSTVTTGREAATDASDAAWFVIEQLPPLAFDHDKIVQVALNQLKTKVRYEPIGFELLPKKFTLSQLQKLYEAVLGQQLDKRNFRKKILKMDLLVALDETQKDVSHRAARFYQFDEQKHLQLKEKGFNFEI
jgi:8-oxo-dGTP diphosphatase